MLTTVINPSDHIARERFPEASTSQYVPVGYALMVTEEQIQAGIREVLALPLIRRAS